MEDSKPVQKIWVNFHGAWDVKMGNIGWLKGVLSSPLKERTVFVLTFSSQNNGRFYSSTFLAVPVIVVDKESIWENDLPLPPLLNSDCHLSKRGLLCKM